MRQTAGERRQNHNDMFPLMDSDGHKVTSERRSGKDRRKELRGSDIATNILHLLH
ncbi:MAG: hypothetical protein OQL19_04225 [Gammaproteobacteria bacterium]|nr:hypothetical protein [Gammaproteobacteria bacterium]